MPTYYNYQKDPCDKNKEKDNELLLKCGKIFDPDLPAIFDADSTNTIIQPIKLASVTVNTPSLHQSCVVSIEYSSIINLVAVGSTAASDESIILNFRLIKECKNKKTKILQEWQYTESNLEDNDNENISKKSFTVTFCDSLDICDNGPCTYIVELVKATPFVDSNNNPTIVYNITNKNILAITSCENHIQCGKSFNRSLPPILDETMPPVKLASVTVDTRSLRNPCVNIKYSSIINLLAANTAPDGDILLRFRLIRECKNKETRILQKWDYMKSNIEDSDGEREFRDSFSINFCECLDCFDEDCYTYTIELIEADPFIFNGNPTVLYKITNKNIFAVISSENNVQCGKEFNRSLPPRLNDDPDNSPMPPVKLASVNVDTRSLSNPCVNIEYSSIIDVIASGSAGNDEQNFEIALKFRLIRECKNRQTEILQEWEYIKSDIENANQERESKDSFTVFFCDCLNCFDSDCCTYTMELIKAAPSLDINDNPEILYNITNKNISAIVACKSPNKKS